MRKREVSGMRTTITFHDSIYKAIKIRAAETNESISDIVEAAVKYQLLEDLEDLEDVTKRKKESTLSFDQLIGEFRAEGLL